MKTYAIKILNPRTEDICTLSTVISEYFEDYTYQLAVKGYMITGFISCEGEVPNVLEFLKREGYVDSTTTVEVYPVK